MYTVQWTGSGTLSFGLDAQETQSWTSSGINYALTASHALVAAAFIWRSTADNPANYDPEYSCLAAGTPMGKPRRDRSGSPATIFRPSRPSSWPSLQPFNTLRFMDWMDTNDSTVADWSDVRPLTYARQSNGTNGVSYQYIIELANELNENVWINLPYQSDSQLQRATGDDVQGRP